MAETIDADQDLARTIAYLKDHGIKSAPSWRQQTVTAVDTVAGTVTVTDQGVTTVARYSGIYPPEIGHLVWTALNGNDQLVFGPVGPFPSEPPVQVTGLSAIAMPQGIGFKWNDGADGDVQNGNGTFELQVASDAAFTTGLVTYKTRATGKVVIGLVAGTTYYGRVRAIDASGHIGETWSATASAMPASITGVDIGPDTISAPHIIAGSIGTSELAVGSVVADRVAVNTLSADRLVTDLALVGAQGIRSSNFVTGLAGWKADGNGNFEINSLIARGPIFQAAPNLLTTGGFDTAGDETGWVEVDFEGDGTASALARVTSSPYAGVGALQATVDAAPNDVTNPGFEVYTGTPGSGARATNWSYGFGLAITTGHDIETTVVHSGAAAGMIASPGSTGDCASVAIPVEPGSTVTIRYWLRKTSGAGTYVHLYYGNLPGFTDAQKQGRIDLQSNATTPAGVWTLYEHEWNVPNGSSYIRVSFNNVVNATTLYFDDVEVLQDTLVEIASPNIAITTGNHYQAAAALRSEHATPGTLGVQIAWYQSSGGNVGKSNAAMRTAVNVQSQYALSPRAQGVAKITYGDELQANGTVLAFSGNDPVNAKVIVRYLHRHAAATTIRIDSVTLQQTPILTSGLIQGPLDAGRVRVGVPGEPTPAGWEIVPGYFDVALHDQSSSFGGVGEPGGLALVKREPASGIRTAALSAQLNLPTGTITVGSTTGFAASGYFVIKTDRGWQSIWYSAKTATQFTGCVGGSGTTSASAAAIQVTGTPARQGLTVAPPNVGLMRRRQIAPPTPARWPNADLVLMGASEDGSQSGYASYLGHGIYCDASGPWGDQGPHGSLMSAFGWNQSQSLYGPSPPPRTRSQLLQYGSNILAANGYGIASMGFPRTWPESYQTIVVCNGDTGAGPNSAYGIRGSATATQIDIGHMVINVEQRCNWIAAGT